MFFLYLMTLPPEAQNLFLILWESVKEHLVKYVRGKMTGAYSYKDCEDIVQEAFIRVMNKYDDYKNKDAEEIKAIIIRTCENLCINERIRNGKIAFESADVHRENDETGMEHDYQLGTDYTTPEDIIISEENEKQIRRIILEMPEKWRDVLQMRIVEEKSYADIAKELKLNEAAARQRFKRARAELIEKLREEGYDR